MLQKLLVKHILTILVAVFQTSETLISRLNENLPV